MKNGERNSKTVQWAEVFAAEPDNPALIPGPERYGEKDSKSCLPTSTYAVVHTQIIHVILKEKFFKKRNHCLGSVPHTFNPSSQEVEPGRSL